MAATDLDHKRVSRYVGLDVARCLALVGMVATHIYPGRTPDGSIALSHELFSGRASALFAVLAGVSLALVSGRTEPVVGRERLAVSAGLAVRAVLIAGLGIVLAAFGSGIAVILTYYGVLFVCGLPFLGLRARALWVVGVLWAALGPIALWWVRPHLEPRSYASPNLGQLNDPRQLFSDIAVTGYYPVLAWLGFLLIGMAIGRTDLSRWQPAAVFAVGGTGAALLCQAVATWRVSDPTVLRELGGPGVTYRQFIEQRETGLYGQTPTDGPIQWMWVLVPHSSTSMDILYHCAFAVAVIGVCLLVMRNLPKAPREAVRILFGAGTMSLTLYSAHVVLRSDKGPIANWPVFGDATNTAYWTHAAIVLAVGAGFAALRWRGPLEWCVRLGSNTAAGWVRAG